MSAPAHGDLVALAEEELELVERGRFDELAGLSARRDALLAALGPVAPTSARPDLERAVAAQARVTEALLRVRAVAVAELMRVAAGRRTARGYAPPVARRLDASA